MVTDPFADLSGQQDPFADLQAEVGNIPEKIPAPSGLSNDEFLRWAETRAKQGHVINGVYYSPLTDEDYNRYTNIKAGRAAAGEQYQKESALTHAARSYAQGGLFGWEPEVTALLAKYLYGTNPEQAAAGEEAKLAQFRAEHPAASIASRFAGGIPSVIAGGQAFGAIPRVGPAVTNYLGSIANPWLRSIAVGGAAGVPIGISEKVAEAGATPENIASGGAWGGAGGAVLSPLIYTGLRGGYGAYRAIADMIKPGEAGIRKSAEAMVRTGTTPEEVRAEAIPSTSAQLQSRGFTDDVMADIYVRGLAGESATDIANDHGLHPDTVRRYIENYKRDNPTPRNMVDIVKELAGPGKSQPFTRFARAMHGISGAPDAAEQLLTRQAEQIGRVKGILGKAAPGEADEILNNLMVTAKKERSAIYEKLYNEPAVIVDSKEFGRILSQENAKEAWNSARRLATSEQLPLPNADEIAQTYGINNRGGFGINPETGQPNPPAQYPLPESGAQPAFVIPSKAFDYFQRALKYKIDDSFKPGGDSAKGYALKNIRDDLIEMLDPATPLQGQHVPLPGFRQMLRDVRASYGPAEALQAGRALAGKLGTPLTKDTLADFKRMTPAQRGLARIGYISELKNRAGEGRGAAGLTTALLRKDTNTEKMIREVFDEKETPGIADRLVKELRGEGISTQTVHDILAGSRTAPMTHDIDEFMQGAQLAGDLVTLNPMGALKRAGSIIAYHTGKQQAEAAANIVSEQNQPNMLRYLNAMSGALAARRSVLGGISGFATPLGPSAQETYLSGEPQFRHPQDERSRSIREIIRTLPPGTRLRYDPSVGGLVAGP